MGCSGAFAKRKASLPAPGERSRENGDSLCIYPSFLLFSSFLVVLRDLVQISPAFSVWSLSSVSPFSFLFMRRMESVLDFSICFQARFLTGPIGVMIHLGFFFCQFSNLFSVT